MKAGSTGAPDTLTYPGSDYYEISVRLYTHQFHSDLPPTNVRGYVQTNLGTNAGGDGSPGSATAGLRTVSSTGACP